MSPDRLWPKLTWLCFNGEDCLYCIRLGNAPFSAAAFSGALEL
jgi:hypothetical protein